MPPNPAETSSGPSEAPPLGPLAAIRFISELALLAGLAYVGARVGSNVIVSIALAILLPVTAAVCWGRFVGPKAAARLADPQRLLLELALFGICCIGLVLVGAWIAAIVLASLYLVGTTHGRRGG